MFKKSFVCLLCCAIVIPAIGFASSPTLPISSACNGISFDKNLKIGSIGNDVKCLQTLLNRYIDTQVATSGAGSPGNESIYFGLKTKLALINYQNKFSSEILTPAGLSAGTGICGILTRAKLNKLLTMIGGQPVCGNGTCETGETAANCVQDCGGTVTGCGNGKCENGENISNCWQDCSIDGQSQCVATGGNWARTEVSCGAATKAARINALKPSSWRPGAMGCDVIIHGAGCVCPSGKFWASKEEGCLDKNLMLCGNGACDVGETAATCPQDCGSSAICIKEGKTALSTDPEPGCCTGLKLNWLADRISYTCTKCGDGVCDVGETVTSCSQDCGKTASSCGDGYCNAGETAANCFADCKTPTIYTPLCNNNGVCETGETGGYSCMQDCKCGDGLCDPGENVTTCPSDCAGTCLGTGKTIYTYNSDGRVISWSGKGCCQGLEPVKNSSGDIVCTQPVCVTEGETTSDSYRKCCSGLQQGTMPWTGGTPQFTCTKCGDGKCVTGETSASCPQDCTCAVVGQMSDNSHLCCAGLNNLYTTSQLDNQGHCQKISTPNEVCADTKCGDGVCNGGETKCNCPQDCGAVTPICGNGICETNEESSCSQDCQNQVRALKPVIYLYPQKTENVNVKIDYAGKIVADYPDYNPVTGWNVTAHPAGRLINLADGKEYSYLFWEGDSYGTNYDMSKGFVVKGLDTKKFLQDTLGKIGLTSKEYNEFIVYWYPKMKDNPYNIIHFAGTEYTSKAKLTIAPQPDSMLRVFMVFKPSQTKVAATPQTFASFERKGFSVVEWGGSEIR